MSVLRKELEKYRDIDEDELLMNLSEEELRRLEDELEELDPDVSLLSASSPLVSPQSYGVTRARNAVEHADLTY